MHKINRFSIYFALLAGLFLNITVTNHLRIFGMKPDMLLLTVAFFGLFFGKGTGLESGLAGGFLKDIFTLDAFGINTFALGATGLLAGILSAKFFKEFKATQILLVLFLSFFSMVLHFIALPLFSRIPNLGLAKYMATLAVPASVYNALISIPLYVAFANIYHLKEDDDLL